jgi:hypothetical protein
VTSAAKLGAATVDVSLQEVSVAVGLGFAAVIFIGGAVLGEICKVGCIKDIFRDSARATRSEDIGKHCKKGGLRD